MSATDPIIIVGASHAGVGMALQLRREGWQGGIRLLGEESYLPYHRPPLTKDFLAGDKSAEQICLRPEKVYIDNNIDLLLGQKASKLDCAQKTIQLADGGTLAYHKLALCTGARARRLPLAEGLAGLHYIRSLDQVIALKHALKDGSRVVIIGGGYIGLEAAAVLCQARHEVTVVEMAARVLQRVTSPQMSDYMTSLHEAHGVRIITGSGVQDIQGGKQVERVIIDGGDSIAADVVIVGIGVVANTELASEAGLQVDDGILVDASCLSSDPHVYAAGDCTRFPSKLYGRLLRLESVQNANDQSRVAAANMAGKRVEYDGLPWFWSDQYQVKLQMAGLSDGYDRVVQRGEADLTHDEGFALFYFKGHTLIAADCINRPQEFMIARTLVSQRAAPDPARLQNPAISPKEFLGKV